MWARTMRKPRIRRARWVERWRVERITVVTLVDQAETAVVARQFSWDRTLREC